MQSRGGADASYEIVELALNRKEDGLLLEIKKKKKGKNEDCKEKKGRQNAWETLVEIGWNMKNQPSGRTRGRKSFAEWHWQEETHRRESRSG